MKKLFLNLSLLLFTLFATGLLTHAQTISTASIKLSGEVTKPLNLTASDLQKYKQVNVIRKDKDGKDHQYSGVALSDILQSAGVSMGSELKGKNLAKYLLVNASDGYSVVFALPELDNNYTDRLIILADKMDGEPLPPTEGPFKVVVQGEKKPARCIRMVTTMQILFAQ